MYLIRTVGVCLCVQKREQRANVCAQQKKKNVEVRSTGVEYPVTHNVCVFILAMKSKPALAQKLWHWLWVKNSFPSAFYKVIYRSDSVCQWIKITMGWFLRQCSFSRFFVFLLSASPVVWRWCFWLRYFVADVAENLCICRHLTPAFVSESAKIICR